MQSSGVTRFPSESVSVSFFQNVIATVILTNVNTQKKSTSSTCLSTFTVSILEVAFVRTADTTLRELTVTSVKVDTTDPLEGLLMLPTSAKVRVIDVLRVTIVKVLLSSLH